MTLCLVAVSLPLYMGQSLSHAFCSLGVMQQQPTTQSHPFSPQLTFLACDSAPQASVHHSFVSCLSLSNRSELGWHSKFVLPG